IIMATGKKSFLCVDCASASLRWSKPEAVARRPTALASLPSARLAVALEQPDGSVGGVAST
ncbi:unnamed protein product, partial [Effrenium voratum]